MNDKELYHYGVLGMRWGFHKKKSGSKKSSKSKIKQQIRKEKSKKRSNETSSEHTKRELRIMARKYNKGKSYVMNKINLDNRTISFVKDTAAIAGGALWVASAFVPGPLSATLNSTAAVVNMISVVADRD